MLDGRYGCAVMVCTGSLLRLLTVLLVLYRRSLIALYRFLTLLLVLYRRSLIALYRFLTALSQLLAFFVPHR